VARQGGRVQLEQSDMRLALNMVKMVNEGFLHAAIEETKQLITKPCAEVHEEKKRGVEFPWYSKVKAGIERHPAMVYEDETDGYHPCQNGTAKNPRTHWRRKRTGSPPQVRRKHPTPEVMPPSPGRPPAPSGEKNRAHSCTIPHLRARYEYKHAPLSGAQIFNPDTYAEDSEYDEDFIPDLWNDEGTSTG